jgi:hypothetical protein
MTAQDEKGIESPSFQNCATRVSLRHGISSPTSAAEELPTVEHFYLSARKRKSPGSTLNDTTHFY